MADVSRTVSSMQQHLVAGVFLDWEGEQNEKPASLPFPRFSACVRRAGEAANPIPSIYSAQVHCQGLTGEGLMMVTFNSARPRIACGRQMKLTSGAHTRNQGSCPRSKLPNGWHRWQLLHFGCPHPDRVRAFGDRLNINQHNNLIEIRSPKCANS